MLSKFLKKTICTKLVIPAGNTHLCFCCNAAEFTKKIKVPVVLVGDPPKTNLIFFCEFLGVKPKASINI